MILVEYPNLVIFRADEMNVWTDGHTRCTPLTWNQGSIWARNERDGSKLNFSEAVFNANFSPEES